MDYSVEKALGKRRCHGNESGCTGDIAPGEDCLVHHGFSYGHPVKTNFCQSCAMKRLHSEVAVMRQMADQLNRKAVK